MSTPFPLEDAEQASESHPKWDPWDGAPKPGFFTGTGFDEDTAFVGPTFSALEGMGSAAYKGAAVLHGLNTSIWGGAAELAESSGLPSETLRGLESDSAAFEARAREGAKQLTPNPATTGAAARTLHGVFEGATLMATGAAYGGAGGAALAVGGTEGESRYMDLREQGVDATTATAAGVLTGVASAAGVVMPAAYGTSLFTRLATGAAANTAFGAINRYGDSKILELGGYQEMADQQKVWDTTQMLVDVALGATFGGIHHLMSTHEVEALHTPDNRDAALTANLALRDRQAGPGVPADPASANAHQTALEKSIGDISADRDVDVTDSGVIDGKFLSRPAPDLSPASSIMVDSLKEAGLFHEEEYLKDLQASLADREQKLTNVSANTSARLEDPLIAEELSRMGDNAGWDQIGGRMIRRELNDGRGNEYEINRTAWILREPWFKELGNKLGKADRDYPEVIKDALAGKKLRAKEARTVDEMAQMAEEHMYGDRSEEGLGDKADIDRQAKLTEDMQSDSAHDEYEKHLQDIIHEREPGEDDETGANRPGKTAGGENPFGQPASVPKEEGGTPRPQSAPSVAEALGERPNLEIADKNGEPTRAADALEKAKEESGIASSEIPKAMQALAACAGRRGS